MCIYIYIIICVYLFFYIIYIDLPIIIYTCIYTCILYAYIYIIYIDFLSVYWMFGPNIATWVAVVPICRALKSNHDQLTRGQDWKHLRSVVNH